MSAPAGPDPVAGEYYRLACLYARAMDRHDPELLAEVIAEDGVVEAPGATIEGLARNQRSPVILRDMYLITEHVIHNQTLTVNGDTAEGETYCTASHVNRPEEGSKRTTALIWAIRYQDRLVRTPDGWRFAHRKLIVDWSETRPVTLGVEG